MKWVLPFADILRVCHGDNYDIDEVTRVEREYFVRKLLN